MFVYESLINIESFQEVSNSPSIWQPAQLVTVASIFFASIQNI